MWGRLDGAVPKESPLRTTDVTAGFVMTKRAPRGTFFYLYDFLVNCQQEICQMNAIGSCGLKQLTLQGHSRPLPS